MNKYIFFRKDGKYSRILYSVKEIYAEDFDEAWYKIDQIDIEYDFVWEQKEELKFIPGIMSPIPLQVSH